MRRLSSPTRTMLQIVLTVLAGALCSGQGCEPSSQSQPQSQATDVTVSVQGNTQNTNNTVNPPVSPPSTTLTLDLGGGVTMDLVLIPAGTFQMGDISGVGWSLGGSDQRPVHTVTLSRAFYMGKYEVTQAQWQAVMGANPSNSTGDLNRSVEQVSWYDCQSFCQATLTRTGWVVRLPTEAEWEYACRANTSTDYYYGNDASQLGNYAWYWTNSGGTTHAVGQKTPNAWGLYDMLGNVSEWCNDWYGTYSAGAQTDPTGPTGGDYRVFRGGSWSHLAGIECCACRGAFIPGYPQGWVGFRLALDSP